jgi:CDP-diacylglycerol--glycerol-3-phosphate 3-phosphatidyltransferase/cardiolipin synthase
MMDQTTSAVAVAPRRARAHIASLPNLLTFGRIAAVPVVVVALYALSAPTGHVVACVVFVSACLTDWLDGYLARVWDQQSELGRMLDPIADKLLVGATLLMLVHDGTIDGPAIFAAAIILCREILVSGLREFLAGLNVKVHVTALAKWKTGVQMVALATLLAAPAVEGFLPGLAVVGMTLLWSAALLTLWTGSDYLVAAIGRATSEEG